MSLKIVGTEKDEFSLGPTEDGTYEEANGGTEMMRQELYACHSHSHEIGC